MAGSKIFLEPILTETVNGVQGAIDDVITVLDPVPEKIDEQISMLTRVANVIGSSINNISVKDGDAYIFDLFSWVNKSLDANIAESNYQDNVDKHDFVATFHSYVSGTFDIILPRFFTSLYLATSADGQYNYATVDYDLTRNGTSVKSGNLYEFKKENTAAATYGDAQTVHDATLLSNITCAANDEFVLTLTVKANVYSKGRVLFNVGGNKEIATAGYSLVNIVDDGIIVQ